MSYSDVVTHSPTIAVVTKSHYMPPWKPEAGWVTFRDERRLTDAQINTIQQWIAGGMPRGDQSKEPPVPTFGDDWLLGKPDLILQMPVGFNVPPDGPDIYRNFVLKTGLAADQYIRAIELKPSARAAMHHVLFYSDTTGGARALDGKDGQPGFPGFGSILTIMAKDPANAVAGGLGGWVPGTTPEFLPDGIAYPLPKGADLILQTHFHPDGKPEVEQTTVGLYFTGKPSRDITQVQAPAFFGIQANIDIPAGKSDYMVRGSFTLPVDVDAFSVSAHTHYLGKGTRLTATLPSSEVRVLLSIKDWDFNWQDTYLFKDLVSLPKGTRIDGELVYDNSAANPNNPYSPPQRVRWGENSTDEMGSLILNVVPKQTSDTTLLRATVYGYVLTPAPQVGNKPLFISAGVVDGASAQAGAVTPGKIIVLYGNRLGPTQAESGAVANGKLGTSAGGTQVTFDGTPAPVLYSSANQVSVIVPYGVDGKAGTQVRVASSGGTSDAVALPVTPVAPAVFSADFTGSGQGAILNQDLSVNSTGHPADKGSIVAIYATGEGQTSPAGVDGLIANGATLPAPVRMVQVTIGGKPAEVLYAGAAPTTPAGLMQINARIPADTPSGDAAVDVMVGDTHSQPGITVAVK
jgi:uncharacterized protein (TIGR03437 family)